MNKRKDSAKVADAYEKLYSELPEKLSGVEAAEQSEKPREALEAMLREHLPHSEQREIDDELRKTASLQRTR